MAAAGSRDTALSREYGIGVRTARCVSAVAAMVMLVSILRADSAPRFGGGMTGYFQYADVATIHGNPSGFAWGLGGRAHFYLARHLRVGWMGSTWRLGYGTDAGDDSFLMWSLSHYVEKDWMHEAYRRTEPGIAGYIGIPSAIRCSLSTWRE